jgi:hypothetical protein
VPRLLPSQQEKNSSAGVQLSRANITGFICVVKK